MRTLRSLFIVTLCWTVVGVTATQAYFDEIGDAISAWENILDDDFDWAGSAYSWYGSFDTTRYGEEMYNYASWVCTDLMDGCYGTCTGSYKTHLANTVPPGECGPWPSWCFETWSNGSCQVTPQGTWSCSCGFFNACICS